MIEDQRAAPAITVLTLRYKDKWSREQTFVTSANMSERCNGSSHDRVVRHLMTRIGITQCRVRYDDWVQHRHDSHSAPQVKRVLPRRKDRIIKL